MSLPRFSRRFMSRPNWVATSTTKGGGGGSGFSGSGFRFRFANLDPHFLEKLVCVSVPRQVLAVPDIFHRLDRRFIEGRRPIGLATSRGLRIGSPFGRGLLAQARQPPVCRPWLSLPRNGCFVACKIDPILTVSDLGGFSSRWPVRARDDRWDVEDRVGCFPVDSALG